MFQEKFSAWFYKKLSSHCQYSFIESCAWTKLSNFSWNIAKTWKTIKRTVSTAQRLKHAIFTLRETVCWSGQKANVLWGSGADGLIGPDSPIVWWVLVCFVFLSLFQFCFEFVFEKQKKKKTEKIFRENLKTILGRSWPYQYVLFSTLWCTCYCLIPQKLLVLTSDQMLFQVVELPNYFPLQHFLFVSFEKCHMISDFLIS